MVYRRYCYYIDIDMYSNSIQYSRIFVFQPASLDTAARATQCAQVWAPKWNNHSLPER